MKRLGATVIVLVLTGCSGAAAVVDAVDSGRGETTPLADGGSPSVGDSAVLATDASDDALPDGDTDAGSQADVSAVDASDATVDTSSPDTGVDADAVVDAGTDAADAAEDADAATDPDTGVDAAPPPVCTNGQSRCSDYQYQVCSANDWQTQSSDQSCCHDPRFSVVGNTVIDASTGLTWYRYGGSATSRGSASAVCNAVLSGGRLPTVAELLAIAIGQAVENFSVCSPTVDQTAFQGVAAGKTWTDDGCVDLNVGATVASCSSPSGFLCVSP